MKKHIRKLLALLLALVFAVQLGEVALAATAEEIRVALDPTSGIELSTPDDLAEGNWFFIRENQFEISETSEEKLYIPIQRAGDLNGEASVTLKLADLSSHFGVNYKAEIFRVKQEAEAELGEFSLVDAIHDNQDAVQEVPELTEEEMAELIAQQGGAELTDAAGNPLGTVTAADGAEDGDALTLVSEALEPTAAGDASAAAEQKSSNPLQAARSAFTGTVSDRQTLGSDVSWMSPALQALYNEGDDSIPVVEQEEDIPNSIPGYTFTLNFAAGEGVKFLVITPLYSEKADGNSTLMLTLEEPDGGFLLHEDFFTSYVNIRDEDEPEPVVVSFSQAEYTAEDGKVTLTVTRAGAINEIVTVRIATYDGSAAQGADYSGVGAKLYFPMGLETRTLEIPVGHGIEEKDFFVTITPVSDCTAGVGTARVVIPAQEQEAELALDDKYLGEPFTDVRSSKGATITGSGGYFTTTDKRNEQVGIVVENGWGYNTYFYDGVRVTWSANIPSSFAGHIYCLQNTKIRYDGRGYDISEAFEIAHIDTNTVSGALTGLFGGGLSFAYEDIDYYFGRELNPHRYYIYAYDSFNSSWFSSPATVTLHSVTPIKREFKFEVLPADNLGLRGVPEDDEKQINGVYINSSLTDASVTVLSGNSFALTAQNSSEFSRFAGVDAVREDGTTYRIANNVPGTRTMTVTVSEELINYLATNGYITWTDNNGVAQGAKRGNITIKPVFEKIPAKVQFDESAYGYFEGFEGGKEYDYYLGERITLKTVLNERGQSARVRGSGIGYYKADRKDGVRLDQSNDSPYLNAAMTKVFLIDQPYICLWPVFDTSGNAVTVQVSNDDLQYFDTSKGILAMDENPNYNPETDVWTFFVADNATVNQVMLLVAAPLDEYSIYVPLWSDTRSSTRYSGAMFPIRVGTSRAENVVTLSVCTEGGLLFPCEVSGTAMAQEINLATGRPGGRLTPAANALVYYGSGSTLTDGSGAFTLPASQVVSNTAVRYAVSYNGALTICEMRAPEFDLWTVADELFNTVGADVFFEEYFDLYRGWKKAIPADVGIVEVPSFSTLGAHITDVYAIQDHHYMSDVKILEMNGQKTELAARVSPGEGYLLDGEVRQENVTGVTFYFQNPLTNALHGVYEAEYDAATDTWRVNLKSFTPDRPDEFSYGDVLYAQIVTDKQLAAVYDAENGIETAMCYDPVSTGYAVISDDDYRPTYFDYNMPIDAESVLGPGGVIERDGGDPALWNEPYDEAMLQASTRTTYGEFPFLGEINTIIKVIGIVGSGDERARQEVYRMLALDDNDDGELMSDDGELMSDAGWLSGQLRIGIAMKFGSLPYGGTRFAFAVTFTKGNSLWDMNMSNPWTDTGAAARFFSSTEYGSFRPDALQRYSNGFFGTALFSMTFALGFYLDFGYLNTTTTEDSGHSTTTHDLVYLGGGGMGGFIGHLATTAPLPTTVPTYAGVEAEASIMFFLGASKDPNKTIDMFRSDENLDALEYGFTYQITGTLTGKGVLGLGFDHALGMRGNLGVKIELCYSPTFSQWFPSNYYFTNRPFSFGSSLVMSGYLDAVFVNVPLATFSYPISYNGYLWLFNQMRIGARVVSFVQSGVNDMLDSGKGDADVIRRCTDLCDQILAKIERFVNPQTEANELREYAYQNGVINAAQYAASFSAEIGGLLGTAIKLMDDDGEAAAPTWSVQPHAASAWVAGDSAELMAAFSPVASTTVAEDTRTQTSARLMDIGNDRLLLVFLGDDPARSETEASVLQYAVYNTETGVWEIEPTAVQPDGTGDYMPDLCDAADDVILTWISTAPDKQVLSEDDPTNQMDMMDVFTVRFPKAGLSAGGGIDPDDVYQITNDTVYDSMPRAVYDDESGDVLVLYTKTMPDTDYAPDSVTQKVIDYTVGGEKVYSVNAYMLYDASQGDWAWDYYYENESSFTDPAEEAAFLAEWGGQRFVRISVDGQSDPAITEMAVSIGYNGLAVYAYTVDKDYDLSTSEDRDLYVQFYDFRDHSTYVPVRLTNDSVSQAMPVLTRSGGDTYLFWLEDASALKYVDVSTMLRSAVLDENEQPIYAVRSDGTFEDGYIPPICTLDMSSLSNSDGVDGLTGYTVLTHETTLENGETYDDLYVIWTAGETYEVEVPGLGTGETRTESCKEIYAAAFIHEDDRQIGEDALATASWSQPYRLTEDHKYHDGVAAAIDSKGDLILMHSEFDMIWHGDDEDWLSTHLTAGVDGNGNAYYEGDCYEYTPTNLVMTRCIPVGSLEVSEFTLSDETPMPGDTVTVTAMLENAGLTTALGCDVRFYETKDGARGRLLYSVVSSDRIPVNTGRRVSFSWTLPDALEGVGVECVVSERNPRNDGYFDPVITEFEPIQLTAELSGEILSVTQKGDVFEAEVSVTNSGNLALGDGAEARLHLECLYGNAKEVYGVDDQTLAALDLSGLAPGAQAQETLMLNIPVSVFDYCGYDAVTLHVFAPDNKELDYSDQYFVCLDEPMALQLGDGSDRDMTVGQSAELSLSYALSAFKDENASVVYTTEDPSVAMIVDGALVAVGAGTTALTATILPYGTSTSVQVNVTNAAKPEPRPAPAPDPEPEETAPENVIVTEAQVSDALAAQTDGTAAIDLSDTGEAVNTAVIPAALVRALANVTAAEDGAVRAEVTLPAGAATLDAGTLQTLAETGKDVYVTVTDNDDGTVTVALKADDTSVDADMKVALPAEADGQVLVIVKPDGTEELVKKSAVVDGTVYARIPAGSTVRLADNAADFPDVADGAWYKGAVDFVSSHALFQGTGKGFEPALPMNRAMLATVLYRLEDAAATGTNPFADVPAGTWYTDAVTWASDAGIVNGTGKGFEPSAPITREQIAVMLFRYVNYLGLDTEGRAPLDGFSDGEKTASWAADAMEWAVSAGLFQGNADGSLNPKGNATRAEVATLLERVVKLIVA